MPNAYICDYIRTPIGRYAGALSSVRPDDLAALTLSALVERNPNVNWKELDEVLLGCANQAGEDNRNIARMATLLAKLPENVPAATINRLCGSGMDAVISAARAIKCGEAHMMIAGGVESMSRAPLVMPKAPTAFSRQAEIYDTTLGWRFVNPVMKSTHGIDSMPETAENVAESFSVSRSDQDKFALGSQQKAAVAIANARLAKEIISVPIKIGRKPEVMFSVDEHPRETTLKALSALKTPFRESGTVTAGNASGINDGASALLIANEQAIKKYKLTPIVSIVAGTTIGVRPSIMGIGPLPATQKLLAHCKWSIDDIDVFELNEAFAAQGLAVLRGLGMDDDDARVNPNGGAIALGHPLGMSGARITGTAAVELSISGKQRAIATMCIGVGQGIAIALESA